MSVKVIPQMFDRIHISRVRRPGRHKIDAGFIQSVLSCVSAMRRSVVVHKQEARSMVLHKLNEMGLDDVFHVSDSCEVSLHPNKLSPMVCRYRSPHHDASSPEVSSFLDAAGAVAFIAPSINSNSAVMPLQHKPRFVREDNRTPLDVGPP